MTEILRLCLDLNIWCAALLFYFKGRQDTSCQYLVRIVREGTCQFGPVQLIISWGMLNRLRLVLERDLGITPTVADLYIDAIRSYAILGAAGVSPQLTLGGTGIIALRDLEDAHVLETALAGRANLLVTVNFRDFRFLDTQILIPERQGIYVAPNHSFHIVHPYLMMEWLKSGQIPPINSDETKT